MAPQQSNGQIRGHQALNSWEHRSGGGQQSFSQPVIGISDVNSLFHKKVHICIPPALAEEITAKGKENPPPHPVWTKQVPHKRYFIIAAESLEDLTEIADFARVELEEPELPLTKIRRQSFQSLLHRANRYAVLEPLGECHCVAVAWRDKPLKTTKASSKVAKELRDGRLRSRLTPWF